MKHSAKSVFWAAGQAAFSACMAVVLFSSASCVFRGDGRTLHVLSTSDVHGAWFDSTYTGGTRPSLMAVKWYVDSIRSAVGRRNVLLLDAGDCLQGDNAAYYFNYVGTDKPHLFPRMAAYMGYDAVVMGNHDIETGHEVFDRYTREMKRRRVPLLAGNALQTVDGKPYWPESCVVHRSGMKILVLGFTNPNIAAWLPAELWSGLEFRPLVPCVQEMVDAAVRKTRADVVVVAVHSGTGDGEGNGVENQGMELFRRLRGVDLVICGHDHRPFVACCDSIALVNPGSGARNLGHAVISVPSGRARGRAKAVSAELVPVLQSKCDAGMKDGFSDDFEEVKAFTNKEIGLCGSDIEMADAFSGPCAMMNLIHAVQLRASGADISFAAPLSGNGTVHAGPLVFNDLFTIYRYENSLFVIGLTGDQVRSYLELSYDGWIGGGSHPGHVLRICGSDDAPGSTVWRFEKPSYNFDSAAGIVYTVDVTKPFGSRVSIQSMDDGSPFDPEKTYSVAMTSYRASGGGSLLKDGAGVDPASVEVLARFPEIRGLVYGYIRESGTISEETLCGMPGLGDWHFVPENSREGIIRDLQLPGMPKSGLKP